MERIAVLNLVGTTFAACSMTPEKSVACFLVRHLICLTPAMFSAYTRTRCAWASCCHSAITVLCTLTTDHTQERAARKRQWERGRRERDGEWPNRGNALKRLAKRRAAQSIGQFHTTNKRHYTGTHSHPPHTHTPTNAHTHHACLSCYYLKI